MSDNPSPLQTQEIQLIKAHRSRRRRRSRRVIRWLFRALMSFFLFFGILRLLIGLPPVQNYLVDRAAAYFSAALHTQVKVGSVDIRLWNRVEINDFFVADEAQDTLLYAGQLLVNVNTFSLWDKKIAIEGISLADVHFHYTEPTANKRSNLQFILDHFAQGGSSSGGGGAPWVIKAGNLRLQRAHFRLSRPKRGELLNAFLEEAHFRFAELDVKDRTLGLRSVWIAQPRVHFETSPRDTIGTYYQPPLDTSTTSNPDTIGWTVLLDVLEIENGRFAFDNTALPYGDTSAIDYSHLRFADLNVVLRDFRLARWEAKAFLENFAAKEQRGFEITRLMADELHVTSNQWSLNGMTLRTPHSTLGDTLAFSFADLSAFSNFVYDVRMDIRLHDATIAVEDLLTVAPILKKNAFFRLNKAENVLLSGRIYDRVNHLKGKDIALKIGNNARLNGKFSFFNLLEGDEAVLNLRLDRLETNMRNVALLLPNVNFPEEFFTLGNLSFDGNFDGFLVDFVAEGNLKTDIGWVKTNLRMNLKDRKRGSNYSGNIGVRNFDLGKWFGNPDFGTVTINYDSTKIDGYGFAINNITARLKSTIDQFTYRGYTYHHIGINGNLDKKLFAGNLAVFDQNIDLLFNGTVDFNDSLPRFDLRTDFRHLDLRPLHLVKQDYRLKGGVTLDFVGNDPNNVVGEAQLKNVVLTTDTAIYTLSDLSVKSFFNADATHRSFVLASDVADGTLASNFDIRKVKDILLQFFQANYPSFAQKLVGEQGVAGDTTFVYRPAADSLGSHEWFDLRLHIKQTRNLTALFNPQLKEIKDLRVLSNFDGGKNKLAFTLSLPQFGYANVGIADIGIRLEAIGSQCSLVASGAATTVSDSLLIPGFTIANTVWGDTLQFDIEGESIADIFRALRLKGKLFVYEDVFQLEFLTSNLFIQGREWLLSGNNYIRFSPKSVETRNIILRSNNERITLQSLGNRGLELSTNNLDLAWIKDFIEVKHLDLSGKLYATVKVKDIFSVQDLSAEARVDGFHLKRDWGDLLLVANMDNLRSPLKTEVQMRNTRYERFYAAGSYTPPAAAQAMRPAHHINCKIEARNFPLDIVEIFLGNSISDTKGRFDADVIFTGTPDDPHLAGNAYVRDAEVVVDYLQTKYTIEKGQVRVTPTGFVLAGHQKKSDAGIMHEGTLLKDELGNTAFAQGAITHRRLRDFGFNITINADEFLVLNTKAEDNDLFYGQAIAAMTLIVTGGLATPDLYIAGTAGKNTTIRMPLSYYRNTNKANFIEFAKDTATADTIAMPPIAKNPIGMSLEMDLNINPNAEIYLIFNEQAGDLIKGVGNGNLKIILTRDGEFKMFGQYLIEKGDYLFTYQNFINKPFEVRKGGIIRWDGDPFNATIDLAAYYKNLNVPPINLILEYLTDDNTRSLARRSTRVDLSMNLKGDLFKPDITFDIQFPTIEQELRSYVENKMTLIRADKNELNRQVFGLIVLGSFFPSDESFAGDSPVSSTGINTLSEVISNQLSIYITDLLSEVVNDVAFISSIDVDVNYRYHQLDDPATTTNLLGGSEFQVGSRTGLFNDRMIVNIGGNLGTDAVSSSGTYITGDFEIEWLVSEDGRLRVRAYNRSEPDITGAGTRLKFGAGLSYRRSFDTFGEFIDGLRNSTKRKPN